MDGWMDGCDRWMDAWMDGWIDGRRVWCGVVGEGSKLLERER